MYGRLQQSPDMDEKVMKACHGQLLVGISCPLLYNWQSNRRQRVPSGSSGQRVQKTGETTWRKKSRSGNRCSIFTRMQILNLSGRIAETGRQVGSPETRAVGQIKKIEKER
jgi:hypothetical protein